MSGEMPPPPPPIHLPPLPTVRDYVCAWCGTPGQGTELTCRACGATIDLQAVTSRSGWTQLPPIRDMARLQFGRSTCQIEGAYVPVADMQLDAADGVYFAHHVLLWKDPGVRIAALPLAGAWKRLLAGLPLVMTEARGPGHIAFSEDRPGEVIALPLQPRQAVEVREHVLLVATSQIAYDWFNPGIWVTTGSGNDKETHYPLGQFMDRFTAGNEPGLLLLHGGGNVFVRRLAEGETILIKASSLLFKDTSVSMWLHIERAANPTGSWFTYGARHIWLRLSGPGRIAIESAYGHFEDNGSVITYHSPATEQRW
jgi:uncharacterized protein (AIM24 family)